MLKRIQVQNIYQKLLKSNVKLKQVEEHKSSFKTYGDLHYSNFKIGPNENLSHNKLYNKDSNNSYITTSSSNL